MFVLLILMQFVMVETIQVCLLTVCVVDFNAVCYDRDNSSLPT